MNDDETRAILQAKYATFVSSKSNIKQEVTLLVRFDINFHRIAKTTKVINTLWFFSYSVKFINTKSKVYNALYSGCMNLTEIGLMQPK